MIKPLNKAYFKLYSSMLWFGGLLGIALRILTAQNFTRNAHAHKQNGGGFFLCGLARERERNRCFLANEYGYLAVFFSYFERSDQIFLL